MQYIAGRSCAVWQCACVETVVSMFSVWGRITVELSYLSKTLSEAPVFVMPSNIKVCMPFSVNLHRQTLM